MIKKSIIPIFVLNWNGNDDTINCLRSIYDSDLEGFIPVLIDNGSDNNLLVGLKSRVELIFNNVLYIKDDDVLNNFEIISNQTIEFLNLFESKIIFIQNSENLGFAGGNNIGLIFAKKMNFSWVMLLNNDTIVLKDTFQKLLLFKNKCPNYLAISPQIRCLSPKNLIWNCGGRLTYFGSRKYYYEKKDFNDLPKKSFIEIDFVTGCALFFNMHVTGILSENFFFGEEDYEFSLRLKKYNLKMACVLDSLIYHKVGSSINKNSNLAGLIYLHYINRLINLRSYYNILHWKITLLLSYFYLPILLYRSNISPFKSIALILKINYYVNRNSVVDKNEFIKSLNLKLT
jgi:GT2 family glycosyltransferase